MMRYVVLTVVLCMLSGGLGAEIITVTKTADDPVDGCDADCSLREAVIAANASADHDEIVVPAGTYVLSLVGANEDAAASGDLDFLFDVTVIGDPAGGTIIDGNLSDRLVHLIGADVELTNLTLTRGTTIGDFYGAGGILVESGNLIVVRCVVSDCTTDGHGGGFFSLGELTVDRCAVIGNTGHNGGGIYHAGPNLIVVNTTVYGNTATTYGSGGVTTDGLAGGTEVTQCTISGNTGSESETISFRSGVALLNSILDGSCAIIGGLGTVSSEGANLESPGDTCGLDHATDQINLSAGDLALGPLQDNGGTTPTRALLPESIAIDAGNPDLVCTWYDQRSWRRVDDSCDVGAFEVGALDPNLVFADGFESGDTGGWTAAVP